jgi:hypothetical protein
VPRGLRRARRPADARRGLHARLQEAAAAVRRVGAVATLDQNQAGCRAASTRRA